ncbi:MAG: hypothetical protein HY890_07930 [Deltaproteobacteria bacterium]|nr:hypothetical protein [Deltaproteobacteria bacterium]
MRRLKVLVIALATVAVSAGSALATPSTHIWAPSTDIQGYGLFHLTADMYLPAKNHDELAAGPNATRPDPVTNLGLTVGVLPYEKLQMEVGFDHITGFSFFTKGDLDSTPMYFNSKVGVPEGSFGPLSPALAIGGYMFGTDSGAEARAGHMATPGTDFNIYYVKAAKTLNPVGRFSVGYYSGNKKLLVDEKGKTDENGIMLCWERTMSEISDNLWLAVDYMGGDNSFGALSYGFSWKFSPNASVIFGYVDQNNDKLAFVEDWFTVQVDIDFDVFGKK